MPPVGGLAYLQLPTRDVAASLAFYSAVLGWTGEEQYGSFEAPGLIGQWTTDVEPAPSGGPVLWWIVADLDAALVAARSAGGAVVTEPWLDQGARMLAEVADPAGTRIGLVGPVA